MNIYIWCVLITYILIIYLSYKIKNIIYYTIARASRLELEIWSLKLPILPIKLYSF
jgi:hypothetical protein